VVLLWYLDAEVLVLPPPVLSSGLCFCWLPNFVHCFCWHLGNTPARSTVYYSRTCAGS